MRQFRTLMLWKNDVDSMVEYARFALQPLRRVLDVSDAQAISSSEHVKALMPYLDEIKDLDLDFSSEDGFKDTFLAARKKIILLLSKLSKS